MLLGLVLLYVATAALARVTYRSILYPIPKERAAGAPAGASHLTLTAEDGVPVHAFHFPAPPGAPTIVHFHGNGETIGHNVWLARRLATSGFGVVLVEFRGYGLSKGGAGPTEDGLYRDAMAALDALDAQRITHDDVVLWGTSLGSGVAVEMARRGRGRALVLVTPYTSIPAMAARIAPFLPTRLIVGDHFDTRAKAAAIDVPTLVIHGEADEVIPFAMGEEIARLIPGARFVRVPGGGHNDLFDRDGAHLFGEIARLVSAAR